MHGQGYGCKLLFNGEKIIMTFVFILLILTMLGVLGVLVTGIFLMARGGEANKKYSNKLMQARIYLQGAALLLFALLILMKGAGS